MPFVLFSQKIFDVERLALTGVQRTNALVDLGSQSAQLLDMRQQLLTNLLLIGFRQIRDFSDGLFERSYHGRIVAYSVLAGEFVANNQ